MPEESRPASTPAAGAVRAGIGVTLAQIASHFAARVLPPEIVPQVDFLLLTGFTAAIALGGKLLRNRYPDLPTPI